MLLEDTFAKQAVHLKEKLSLNPSITYFSSYLKTKMQPSSLFLISTKHLFIIIKHSEDRNYISKSNSVFKDSYISLQFSSNMRSLCFVMDCSK